MDRLNRRWRRQERERQQARKYAITMRQKRQQEADQIKTMEMLLDARWNGVVFISNETISLGLASPYNDKPAAYYDPKGNSIPEERAKELTDRSIEENKGRIWI